MGAMRADRRGDLPDTFWWATSVPMSPHGKGLDMRSLVRNLALGYFGSGHDGCSGLVSSCLAGVGTALSASASMLFWLLCSFEVRGRAQSGFVRSSTLGFHIFSSATHLAGIIAI